MFADGGDEPADADDKSVESTPPGYPTGEPHQGGSTHDVDDGVGPPGWSKFEPTRVLAQLGPPPGNLPNDVGTTGLIQQGGPTRVDAHVDATIGSTLEPRGSPGNTHEVIAPPGEGEPTVELGEVAVDFAGGGPPEDTGRVDLVVQPLDLFGIDANEYRPSYLIGRTTTTPKIVPNKTR